MELYVSAISIPNEDTKNGKLLQNFQLRYKNLQNRHQLANCITIRTHHNGKVVAESSAALQHQSRLAPQATTRCETVGEKLRFGRTTSRGIAPYQNGLAQSTR